MNEFSIVGAGRLGTCLAAALAARGWKPVVLVDRDPQAARQARRIVGAGAAATDIRRAAAGTGPVFLTVPDDAIEPVARRLARAGRDWTGRLVFHTSGLVPASALEPLRKNGALVAAFHPAQSFPDKSAGAHCFQGVFWALEGDGAAVRAGRGIVRRLGGRAIVISEADKPLYHAACSLASNAFISLEVAAAELLAALGIGENRAAALLAPLVQGTLQNVKKMGLKRALTGPIVRGDIDTVRKHLEALRSYPSQAKLYRVLGEWALETASGRGLSASKVRALRRTLRGG